MKFSPVIKDEQWHDGLNAADSTTTAEAASCQTASARETDTQISRAVRPRQVRYQTPNSRGMRFDYKKSNY